MKILVTGSNGQLGQAIIKNNPKLMGSRSIELIKLSKAKFNLNNLKQCKSIIKELKPDWVINCAAYTDVDNAEKEVKSAIKINSLGPKIIAESLLDTGGKLLQISTDFVFNGIKSSPYLPEDKKNPLGVYGESKSIGENFIQEILGKTNQANILRTSWLMGPSGKNFATTMLNLHRTRDQIKVVSDQIGSPSTTNTVSIACWNLIEKDFNGLELPMILHCSDSGVASWYDIAVAIGELGKKTNLLKSSANVIPIPSKEFPTLAKRPSFSVLDCFKSRKLLSLESIHWNNSLEKILYIKSQNDKLYNKNILIK